MLPSLDRTRPALIKTKFSTPQLRAGLVLRPRLMHLLAEGIACPLTLICAPAGYGKTTLLAEWIVRPEGASDSLRPKICWLSLDQNDNDPDLFLNYLLGSVENNLSPADSASLAALSTFPIPPIQTVLGLLINDLVNQSGPIVLALDDYQFITNPAIHEGMAFLLDHLPTNVHLVILTRADPPIPMARLRARGQLTEIRADDLRFTLEETTCLLNQVLAFGLTAENVFQLDERTEGWAAGLQMAALALASQPNAAAFVKNFSGSHRYILDYLMEEVLSHQPADVQKFLLETSVLGNLSAPLCDAVTGIPSRDGHRSSQQLLGYLEQANLFLIPLDSERTWYRYHHLFADLLRARLDQQAPGLARELHSRASCWYEANQRHPEAIDHALAGGQFEHACTLIEAQVSYRVTHNGMGLLLGWIHKLPADMALNRPWLCIAQAWSLMFTNESDQSEPLLRAAEGNIPPDAPIELQNDLRGQIACLWAGYFANIYDETQRTIEMARQALTYLSPADAVNRTYAKYLLGRMYFLRGDFSQALPILTEIVHDCIQAAATNYLAQTLSLVSKICRLEARLQDSIDLLREGCAFIEARDPRRITVSGMAFIGQVDVLREWNQLDEAEDLARRSLELLLAWENPSSICSCYTWMVRIYLAKGNPAMAEAALNSASAAIRGRRPMAGVTSDLNNARVWYWLTTEQIQKASQWVLQQKSPFSTADTYLICQELDEIVLARVLIAEGKPEQAQLLLEPLAAAAERGSRFGRLIEIQILQALAFQLIGDDEQARILLEKSLTLAEPEGYIRSFIDEGEPMRKLLLTYSHNSSSLHKTYAQKLLACLGVPGQPDAAENHSSNLVEPLTPREIEVLHWMAEGFSNHQIAEKLFLAEGTVKYYVHAVLGKLAVRSRTQAILEAKKLKII